MTARVSLSPEERAEAVRASVASINAFRDRTPHEVTPMNATGESVAELIRDAERWRKFTALLQSVYDGETFESELLDVYCSMMSGYKSQRTMQAELRWTDRRDEPLDLGRALDAAMIGTPDDDD